MKKKRSELKSRYNKSRKMIAKAQELFENAVEYINRASEEFDDDIFTDNCNSLLDVLTPILDGEAPVSFSCVTDYLENEGAELVSNIENDENEEDELDM